jgi:hypothetical protein
MSLNSSTQLHMRVGDMEKNFHAVSHQTERSESRICLAAIHSEFLMIFLSIIRQMSRNACFYTAARASYIKMKYPLYIKCAVEREWLTK